MGDSRFIAVALGRVDVTVAGGESSDARLGALVLRREVDAKSELRDEDGRVREGESRCQRELGAGHFEGGSFSLNLIITFD